MLSRIVLARLGRSLGFTLIEMAIVLVVIGLVISGGLVAVTPIVENAKYSETRSKMDRIEQALTVHVVINGCLPCPAQGGTSSTTVGVGNAFDDAVYVTPCADNACTADGVVPWVKLGLSEADITDGFGNRISYDVDDNLTDSATSMVRAGSTYPAGTLLVNNYGGQIVTTAAAYVLISHGANRAHGFPSSTGGSRVDSAFGSTIEDDNVSGSPAYVQDDIVPTKGTTHFDDLVRWRSAPIIIEECGPGSCGNPT